MNRCFDLSLDGADINPALFRNGRVISENLGLGVRRFVSLFQFFALHLLVPATTKPQKAVRPLHSLRHSLRRAFIATYCSYLPHSRLVSAFISIAISLLPSQMVCDQEFSLGEYAFVMDLDNESVCVPNLDDCHHGEFKSLRSCDILPVANCFLFSQQQHHLSDRNVLIYPTT
jgi:hypothetical protein